MAVHGRIQTRSYERDGQRRYITEVVGDEVVFLIDSSGGARTPASMPEYPQIGQETDFNAPLSLLKVKKTSLVLGGKFYYISYLTAKQIRCDFAKISFLFYKRGGKVIWLIM